VLVGLIGAGMLARSLVGTVRAHGVGKGRLTSQPGALWFWTRILILIITLILILGWALMLDK
jgi:hypothetical protein